MTHLQQLMDRLASGADRDGITQHVVGAVIHADGQVLIVRRRADDPYLAGIEELPSGGVDPGEDLVTALARELAEEIGWTGAANTTPDFVGTFDYTSGSGRKTRQFTFALAHDGAAITLSDEHDAYRWVDPADLDDTDLTVETARTIRQWATKGGGS